MIDKKIGRKIKQKDRQWETDKERVSNKDITDKNNKKLQKM